MRYIVPICYIYVAALFIALLRFHEKLHIEQIAMSFLFCLVIPFSLTTVVYIRDRHGMWLGIFYVLMALGGAWLSDTGAYFAGRAFGNPAAFLRYRDGRDHVGKDHVKKDHVQKGWIKCSG